MKGSKLYKKYSLQLGNIFESNWGYSTMNPGTFLTYWVKASDMEEDRCSKTNPIVLVLVTIDILESGQLK